VPLKTEKNVYFADKWLQKVAKVKEVKSVVCLLISGRQGTTGEVVKI